MKKIKLTTSVFNSLQREPDGARVQRLWAEQYQGLGVDLGLTKRSIILKYKSPETGKVRVAVLEKFKNTQDISQAEIESVLGIYFRMRGQIREGLCPLLLKREAINAHKAESEATRQEKACNAYTLSKAFREYSLSRAFTHDICASTQNVYVGCFNNHIFPVLGKVALSNITPKDIYAFLDTLSDSACNIAITIFSKLQKRAIREEKIKQVFIFDADKRSYGVRNRPIESIPEFLKWLSSDEDRVCKCALKMQLLTASGAMEIYGLRWDEIKDGVISIPSERLKNKRIRLKQNKPLLIPILPLIEDVLDEMRGLNDTYIFPNHLNNRSINNAKIYSFLKTSPFNNSSNDIRKTSIQTIRDELLSSTDQLEVIKAANNRQVNKYYIFGDDLKTRREILLKWHDYLSVLSGKNIIMFRGKS